MGVVHYFFLYENYCRIQGGSLPGAGSRTKRGVLQE